MTLNLDLLWDNFLTSGIKPAPAEALKRIRFLNLFELVFCIAALSLGLFYLFISAFFLFYISVIACLLGIGVIFLLRTTKNLVLAGNLAVFILWFFLMGIRWNTGGMSASGPLLLTWIWNAVLILLAIFLTGYMWGTIWACLVFVESGIVISLFRAGYIFDNLIPPEISSIYALGFYLAGLLVILLFAFLFEHERFDARKREDEKSKLLIGSKKYAEDILDRIPVPTFVLDKSHQVVQWNRASREMSGIEFDEALGNKVWNGFFMDEDGSLADKLIEDPGFISEKYADSIVAYTDSGCFTVDTLLPYLRGGVRAIITTAPIMGQDDGIKGAIQSIQDVGNRDGILKTGEDTAGDFFSLDDLDCPVFKINSNGKISGWNKACEDSLGYFSSQVIGKNPLSLVSKKYRRYFRDAVVTALRGGRCTEDNEWKYHTSQGKHLYVIARIYPVRGLSGNIRECAVINTDITKLKRKLKDLGTYATEKKEKLKALREEYNLLKSNVASFIRSKSH